MTKADTSRLYERVARDLGAQIADGAFPVGARLPSERHLAQTYGVSRPTIREAIIALELDGVVEVKMGSGVYVVSRFPKGGQSGETDIGPFELLEARVAIEGEACALAATHIDDEAMVELEALVAQMDEAATDIAASEAVDRQFHVAIARATGNSAMVAAVEMLWDARARSPQYRLLSNKAHDAGVVPRLDEHVMILEALRSRSADAARGAMRSHLSRVLESLLEATEVQEVEQARARVNAQRRRYAAGR